MKNILIGLTVFGLALGIGLFSVSYATNLTVNEMAESIDSTVDNFEESVEVKIDRLETAVFGDDNDSDDDDYDHKGFEMKGKYHSEKKAIFEDNQVTQEEIDALTYTELKEHLLEEYATELEDGVITKEELTAHKEAEKAEHEAIHAEKEAIFEDNQVTQEEIDSITYTKLKEKLLEEFVTELEDGVITEEELIAHKEVKKAEHEAMHAEKAAIFEDNQVTQEEIDALTNTKLKDRLTERYASELEDGVITEEELKSGHENHKGKGHKKGRGMHDHDHDDE